MLDQARRPVALRMRAWRGFLETHSRVIDALSRDLEAETGIPLLRYEVLDRLQDADERRLRMHELADSILLSRSAATRFVDRMEAAGLVRRIACDADRRGTYVELTEHGLHRFHEAVPIYHRAVAVYFADLLSDEEAAALADTCERILGALHARV